MRLRHLGSGFGAARAKLASAVRDPADPAAHRRLGGPRRERGAADRQRTALASPRLLPDRGHRLDPAAEAAAALDGDWALANAARTVLIGRAAAAPRRRAPDMSKNGASDGT